MLKNLFSYIVVVTLLSIGRCDAVLASDNKSISTEVDWPQEIELEEEILSFTPVSSGSVILALMYGDVQSIAKHVYVLLPNGLNEDDTLCFKIETRDGAYIGRGSLTGAIAPGVRLRIGLAGKEIQKHLETNNEASLAAWVAPNGDCENVETTPFIPTSWSDLEFSKEIAIFANSTGHIAKLSVRNRSNGKYQIYPCLRIKTKTLSRAYDVNCKVSLCDLALADKVYFEIRNRNERVHLEPMITNHFKAFCSASDE